jgi:hypothetical protein
MATARKQSLEILPDEVGIETGPAMRALSPRHRQAVIELFNTGGNRTEALRRCGYGGKPDNLNSHASKFFSDRRVRAAIREQCEAKLQYIEPELLEAVAAMARDEKVKSADRLRALAMLWDRSRPVESKHQIEITHTVSDDERDVAHFRALQRIGAPEEAFQRRFGSNGLERVKLLVLAEDSRQRQLDGRVIDAEAVEVEDA